MSNDWHYGILSNIIRICTEDNSNSLKWIIIDGPVETIWVESLNTVLDDNKKLCLSTGETIKLSPEISMFFEVENLHYASPATVSRCGMVYFDPDDVLGWNIFLEKWTNNIPL